jgi:rSAM/selenodomain-associated transferase 2
VRLGVVIPTLDEEQALAILLPRLAEADAPERVVVADGGSRDGTEHVARAHGATFLAAPRGRGTQLAAGARALDTELLLFLHADCVPAAGALARLRAAFADPALQAGALEQQVLAEGLFYRLVERCADLRVRRLGLVYGDSGLCVRRTVYEAVGGFRPLSLFEDVDLSRRLRGAARPRLVRGARLGVSARRWKREGALRATLRNWMLSIAYAAGANPERLARLYPPPADRSRCS